MLQTKVHPTHAQFRQVSVSRVGPPPSPPSEQRPNNPNPVINANVTAAAAAAVMMSTAETETAQTQYMLDKKKIGGPITPISNSILVKVRSVDATSGGGIILPEKVRMSCCCGVMVDRRDCVGAVGAVGAVRRGGVGVVVGGDDSNV